MRHFLFFLLFNSFCSFCQTNCIKYKQESNAAYKAAIIQKNYPKALKVLKKLESKYEVLKQEEYMLQAYCFKSNNQNTEVAKSLRKAWSNYGQDGNYIYSILELSPLKLMQGFDSIQKAIVNEGYNNFAKLKKPIFDTIDKLFTIIDIRDQEIRSLFLDTTIIYTKTEIDSLSKIQLVLDSLNMADFKEYVLRHGFPGELAFPGNALMGFPFLIHTGDNANFVRDMNPIFLEELRKGNMPPSFYLSWRDRVQLHNKLPSKFGMFDIQEVRLLTKKQLKKIGKQRLKYGLVEVYPIPDKVLNFK